MINGIGKSGAGRVELSRSPAGQAAGAPAPVGSSGANERSAGLGGLVSDLVSLGAPVDTDKVAALRQAIAEGRYRADPNAIAERMIAADLDR